MSITSSRISSFTANPAQLDSSRSTMPEHGASEAQYHRYRIRSGGNRADPKLFDMLRTLEILPQLPEGHGYFLEREVVMRAQGVLSYIIQNYDIPIPKLLPEDSECLSFTWERGGIKRYLSLTEEGVDLTFFNQIDDEASLEALCEDGDLDHDRIARALKLAVSPMSSTVD